MSSIYREAACSAGGSLARTRSRGRSAFALMRPLAGAPRRSLAAPVGGSHSPAVPRRSYFIGNCSCPNNGVFLLFFYVLSESGESEFGRRLEEIFRNQVFSRYIHQLVLVTKFECPAFQSHIFKENPKIR